MSSKQEPGTPAPAPSSSSSSPSRAERSTTTDNAAAASQPAAKRTRGTDKTREPLYARDIWGEMVEHEDEQLAENVQELEDALKFGEWLKAEEIADRMREQHEDTARMAEGLPCIAVRGVNVCNLTLLDAQGCIMAQTRFPASRTSRIVFSPNGILLAWHCARAALILNLHEYIHLGRDFDSCTWATAHRDGAEGTASRLNWVCFSPCGRFLATAGLFPRPNPPDRDHVRAEIWHIASRSIVATIQGPATENLGCLAFSPDSTHLLVGDGSGSVSLWKFNGRILREPVRVFADRHSKPVDDIAFSPNGELALSASRRDKSVRVWEAGTGAPFEKQRGPPMPRDDESKDEYLERLFDHVGITEAFAAISEFAPGLSHRDVLKLLKLQPDVHWGSLKDFCKGQRTELGQTDFYSRLVHTEYLRDTPVYTVDLRSTVRLHAESNSVMICSDSTPGALPATMAMRHQEALEHATMALEQFSVSVVWDTTDIQLLLGPKLRAADLAQPASYYFEVELPVSLQELEGQLWVSAGWTGSSVRANALYPSAPGNAPDNFCHVRDTHVVFVAASKDLSTGDSFTIGCLLEVEETSGGDIRVTSSFYRSTNLVGSRVSIALSADSFDRQNIMPQLLVKGQNVMPELQVKGKSFSSLVRVRLRDFQYPPGTAQLLTPIPIEFKTVSAVVLGNTLPVERADALLDILWGVGRILSKYDDEDDQAYKTRMASINFALDRVSDQDSRGNYPGLSHVLQLLLDSVLYASLASAMYRCVRCSVRGLLKPLVVGPALVVVS